MANARDQASQSALVTVTVVFLQNRLGSTGCGERLQLGAYRFKASVIFPAKAGMAFNTAMAAAGSTSGRSRKR
ncbi:hypothetical protein [Mesorhizobium sp. B2-8-9]|uniref:hypothetical protein n=1 Tax=Mesorhizobium sp. B2-8-9 TaxID=2589899 RepID=UPI00112EAAEF|nr:hypothetical protein [Mesorhizobium sp. B2-8-9]TPI81150.1 hypothetical protein FJ423_11220 [Mesorhizobium sp. B2-8-9]